MEGFIAYCNHHVHFFVRNGGNAKNADAHGRTILLFAAQTRNEFRDEPALDVLTSLLDAGGGRKVRDKPGRSVLGHAKKAYADPQTAPADHDVLEQIISVLERSKAAE